MVPQSAFHRISILSQWHEHFTIMRVPIIPRIAEDENKNRCDIARGRRATLWCPNDPNAGSVLPNYRLGEAFKHLRRAMRSL